MASNVSPSRVAESALQLLVHEVVAATERSAVNSADVTTGPETSALVAHAKLEALGYDVGFRFVERVAQQRLVHSEPIEAIKFICKVWTGTHRRARVILARPDLSVLL